MKLGTRLLEFIAPMSFFYATMHDIPAYTLCFLHFWYFSTFLVRSITVPFRLDKFNAFNCIKTDIHTGVHKWLGCTVQAIVNTKQPGRPPIEVFYIFLSYWGRGNWTPATLNCCLSALLNWAFIHFPFNLLILIYSLPMFLFVCFSAVMHSGGAGF